VTRRPPVRTRFPYTTLFRSLQAVESKHASLEAVQKAALGQSDENVRRWLESGGLADRARVAQSLEVESGWARAVETVLGRYLQADRKSTRLNSSHVKNSYAV